MAAWLDTKVNKWLDSMKSKVIKFGSFFLLLAGLFLSCQPERCEFRSMKTIEFFQDGDGTPFIHRVLVRDFSASCFDSATCIGLLDSYLNQVTVGIPVGYVSFHNSGEWYYHPSKWTKDPEIDDLLVLVSIQQDGHRDFTFYTQEGYKMYSGPNWYKGPQWVR